MTYRLKKSSYEKKSQGWVGEGRGKEESGLSGSLEMIINMPKQDSSFVFNVTSYYKYG